MTISVQVGAGVVDLEFPLGLRMAGYARRSEVATARLDPLQCRAVAFSNETATLVVLVYDLVYVPQLLVSGITERLVADLGLNPAQVMVTATHTHAAPADIVVRPELLDRAVEAAARAVPAALDDRRPAALVVSETDVPGVAANRRDPGGPVDTTARVLVALPSDPVATGSELAPIATLVEFACHPTILEHDNLAYSADWVGAMRELVDDVCGGVTLFLQGCAGDVNPVFTDHSPAERRRVGRLVGSRVAAQVFQAFAAVGAPRVINLSWNEDVPAALDARRITPALYAAEISATFEVRELPAPEDAAARLILAEAGWQAADGTAERRAAGPELGRCWAEDLAVRGESDFGSMDPIGPGPYELRVQAFALGVGCVLVALPGEPFTVTGQQVRASRPGTTVFISGYANLSPGYLPPAAEVAASGYEAGSARLRADAADWLVHAADQVLCDLTDRLGPDDQVRSSPVRPGSDTSPRRQGT